MNTETRIQLNDNMMSIFTKMSEGNPGAAQALMELYEKSSSIDPQSALGPVSGILSLDTHGIYGTDIYVLWNDKCDRDARKVLVLLRAVQLGFMPESKLQEMAGDQMRKINLTEQEFSDYESQVCERLEQFQRAA